MASAATNGFRSESRADPTTKRIAASGQGTWHITPALDLTGGLRLTHENRSGSFVSRQVADATAYANWAGRTLPTHGALVIGGGSPADPGFDPRQPGARVRVIKAGSFLCASNYCARYRPGARHAQDQTLVVSHPGFRTVHRLN